MNARRRIETTSVADAIASARGSKTTDGFTLSQNAIFEGEGYTNGGFTMDTTSSYAGSIFADYANVTGNGFFSASGTPPNGSLGSKTTRTN